MRVRVSESESEGESQSERVRISLTVSDQEREGDQTKAYNLQLPTLDRIMSVSSVLWRTSYTARPRR